MLMHVHACRMANVTVSPTVRVAGVLLALLLVIGAVVVHSNGMAKRVRPASFSKGASVLGLDAGRARRSGVYTFATSRSDFNMR